MSEATATWRSGNRQLQVVVLSSPDAIGRIEVEFQPLGGRDKVRRSTLHDLSPAAERLLALGDKFVTVKKAATPIVRRPAPAPLPLPLPGAEIDRAAAALLFSGKVVDLAPPSTRLRLVGRADGSVVLQAWDVDRIMIGEKTYTYKSSPPSPPPRKLAERLPDLPKRKRFTVNEQIRLQAEQKANGRTAVYATVHPDIPAAMRDVKIGKATIEALGGPVMARKLILKARRDKAPVPAPFWFGIEAQVPHLGCTRLLVVVGAYGLKREAWVVMTEAELADEQKYMANQVWGGEL